MLDPYKRMLSIVLWGIGLVNYVQLTSLNNNEINPILFIFLNIILWSTLIIVIIRKYYVIKIVEFKIPLILTILIIGLFDYAMIKDLFSKIGIYNLLGIIVVFCALVLLNISLFFEIAD